MYDFGTEVVLLTSLLVLYVSPGCKMKFPFGARKVEDILQRTHTGHEKVFLSAPLRLNGQFASNNILTVGCMS